MSQPNVHTLDLFARTAVNSGKLNLAVLLSRTAHVQFHTGQIRLVVKP